MNAINLVQKLGLIDRPWSLKVVAQLNDYEIKLVKLHGDFVWHQHDDTDEAFFVIDGEMRIDFRDGAVQLRAGEMFVVPKGVEHKPFAERECSVMLVEPKGVVNTGGSGGDLTAPQGEWI